MILLMDYTLFAHAADQHTETTSALEHQLTQPLVALPLFFFGLIALFLVLKQLNVKPPHIIMIFMSVFFVCGVLLFSLVPAISVISLSAGIFLALAFALTSI